MGSSHFIFFIVKRNGVNRASKTRIRAFYCHSLYGINIAYVILPLLKTLKQYPYLFEYHKGQKEEFIHFLATTISYNLQEGARDNHVHIQEEDRGLKYTESDNGITIIDVSDLYGKGPSYCLMRTGRSPKGLDMYRPLSLQDYLAACGEPHYDEKQDLEELPGMPHYLMSLRKYNLSRPVRYYAEAHEAELPTLLERKDLLPLWPELPDIAKRRKVINEDGYESEEDDEERDEEETELEQQPGVVESLYDLCVKSTVSLIQGKDKKDHMKAALEIPAVFQNLIFQRLLSHRRSLIDQHIELTITEPTIKSLDLSLCKGLTDQALEILSQASSCRSYLESFTISKNKKITAKGINILARSCSSLVDLRIVACPSVSAAQLDDSTKAIMSFSHRMEGQEEMDIVFILPAPERENPLRPSPRVWVMRRSWLYSHAALYFLNRVLHYPTPLWMFFSSDVIFSPYGQDTPEAPPMHNVLSTFDNLPGLFCIDSSIGVFDDVWNVRKSLIEGYIGRGVPSAALQPLQVDATKSPKNGTIIIDLQTMSKDGKKRYAFVASHPTPLGVSETPELMTPLSASQFAQAFLPLEGSGRAKWSQGRSDSAQQRLIDSVYTLAKHIEQDFALLTAEDMANVPETFFSGFRSKSKAT